MDESEGRGRDGGRDRGDSGRGRDRDTQGRDDRDSRGRGRDRVGRGRDGHDGRGRDGRGGRGSGRRGGRGGQRGDVRAAVMSLLAERPMHGYEMLGELDDRTGGLWRPSPGSLYPALQLLEDQGLVRSVIADGRRRFELTEAGQAEQAAAPATLAPWDAILGAADQGDVALSGILRQVAVAADQVAEVGSAAQKASAETMLAGLRRQLYLLLADSPDAEGSAAADTADSPAPTADKGQEARETWNRVEDYFDGALLPHDTALEQALQSSQQAGLPGINVSPSQGKLLHLLARGIGARRILEVGTLGGYSTIWLARALPADGSLISLELDEHHAEVARANVAGSGLAKLVDIRTGPALASLEALGAAGQEPFDLVFIDADKESNPDYFSWAMRLTHPGSLVVVDNVVRRGRVADDDNSDPDILGVRRMIAAMATDDRIDATTIQTVGSKGYDGLTIGLVTEPADER